MQKNTWAKTILSAYRYLERVSDSIDKVIEKKAVNSFYMFGLNFNENTVEKITSKIIELSERKVKLINLKVLTDMALANCEIRHAQVLIEKYFDGDKSREIAERHNLSLRSYFRRIAKAEEEVLNYLISFGYNEEKLSTFLSSEKWIFDIYSRYTKLTTNENIELININLKTLQLS